MGSQLDCLPVRLPAGKLTSRLPSLPAPGQGRRELTPGPTDPDFLTRICGREYHRFVTGAANFELKRERVPLSLLKLTSILLSVFYGYAVVRYHFGKNVDWKEWPFVLNKAMAWLGFTLLALSILRDSWIKKLNVDRKQLGLAGFLFALIHVAATPVIFGRELYPKFYDGAGISLNGWMSISAGVASALIFSLPLIASLKGLPRSHWIFGSGKPGLLVLIFHPLLIGIAGWFSPAEWPYHMPPITLWAVVTGLVVLLAQFPIKLTGGPRHGS